MSNEVPADVLNTFVREVSKLFTTMIDQRFSPFVARMQYQEAVEQAGESARGVASNAVLLAVIALVIAAAALGHTIRLHRRVHHRLRAWPLTGAGSLGGHRNSQGNGSKER